MRRFVIVVMLLAAGSSAAGWIFSHSRTHFRSFQLSSQTLAYVHLSDGLFRAGVTTARVPIEHDPKIVNGDYLTADNDCLQVCSVHSRACVELLFPNQAQLGAKGSKFAGSGFAFGLGERLTARNRVNVRLSFFRVPAWFCTALFAAYPSWTWFARRRGIRGQRRATGCCIRCGRHLGGNPFDGCAHCNRRGLLPMACSAVSLVLLIITSSLWVISEVPKRFIVDGPNNLWLLAGCGGGLARGGRSGSTAAALSIFKGFAHNLQFAIERGRFHAQWVHSGNYRRPSDKPLHATVPLGPVQFTRFVCGPLIYDVNSHRPIQMALPPIPPGVTKIQLRPGQQQLAVSMPPWLAVIGAGAYPMWQLVSWMRRRRTRRRQPGLCHRCGYDLTGLTVPRCPECGTAFRS